VFLTILFYGLGVIDSFTMQHAILTGN